jgi:hypothetical protein
MATVTFGTLQSRISARLIDPSNVAVSASNVAQAINDAVAFWKTRMFYFNQNTANLTLDVNDPYILGYGNTKSSYPSAPVLPQDFLFEDPDNGFTIPYNNLTYKIEKVSQAIYDNANIRGNGLPYIYCFRQGNYEIYFFPQIAYTCKVNYFKDYQPLVNSTDTNDFTNYADKLIEYDAIGRLLADLRLDDERAEKFFARAQSEYTNLKSRSRKQNATGRLEVESILN